MSKEVSSRVVTRFGFRWKSEPKRSPGERNKGKSLTVPDKSISIRTLIEKYVGGLDLTREGTPRYGSPDLDDEDWGKVAFMDLAEKDEVRERLRQRASALQAQLAERSALEKERQDRGAEQLKKLQDKVDSLLKEKRIDSKEEGGAPAPEGAK